MRFHPRIHPVNYPLLRELAPDHPAARALQIHAEARDVCVGKEIDWPDLAIVGIDQVWWSEVESREYRFSWFAYMYISYDLFLDGWAESAPEATKSELDFLEELPKIRTLLDECDRAAHAAKNAVILPLLAKAKEFADALEFAVRFRIKSAPNHGSVTAGARPTKSHPGIHRFNYYLLRDLPSDHPAVQALNTHVAARQMCVSKQSNRPDSGIAPIDQVWLSKVDSQEHRFSTLVKDNIDFDLYLDGWVESAPEATEIERLFLESARDVRTTR